ncbi:C-C motif chemokine 8-like [Protopterus annectens]|uniref:C-C motif chemokine 8-like n=1 Tax=Protopterus annectens TaxID=7888 RepID=UPI001CFA69DB|nr:C-C motif chemokine 8-like [Protopterus annectens]
MYNSSLSQMFIVMVMLLLISHTATLPDFRRPTKVTTRCCESISSAKIPYKIVGFQRQNPLGPCVSAIIFFTEGNGAICVHPKAPWVLRQLRELEKPASN